MNIINNQEEVIESFGLFDDWLEKYQYIIDLGKNLPALDEKHKIDENLLQGCQSRVWMVHELVDGKVIFHANSDAAIVSGLIALLLRLYDGREPRDILDTPADFVDALALQSHLSPTPSNGLGSMLAAIRRFAEEALEAA